MWIIRKNNYPHTNFNIIIIVILIYLKLTQFNLHFLKNIFQNSKVRTLFTSVILFLFLFVELFGYMYWENKLLDAKTAAASSIENNKETLVNISVKKDNNISDWSMSNEFLYNGILYDIVSSKVINDSIVFLCFQDINETWIEKEVEKCINNFLGRSGHKKKHNFYGKYAAKKVIEFFDIGLDYNFFLKHYKFKIDYIFHYQLMIMNTPFVPPEFKS